jgi:hypothetical protein
MHTGAKQENTARCFVVGREYEVNADNLLRGDIQQGNTKAPAFFYSERWLEMGKPPHAPIKDFPMFFLTPGERVVLDDNRSRYEFDAIVFDLMHMDRNNAAGNATALRDKEQIWSDTERIALEVLDAYKETEQNLVNDVYVAELLGLPRDPMLWTPTQAQQVAIYYQDGELQPGQVSFLDPLMPFEYDHNERLAGVSLRFSVTVYNDCPDGQFLTPKC